MTFMPAPITTKSEDRQGHLTHTTNGRPSLWPTELLARTTPMARRPI